MLHQTTQYIKFLLRSTNQHGVHSPFVYNLVTQCFYDKTRYPAYQKMASFRKQLVHDKTNIEVTDLGAGSQVTNQKIRAVSNIAKCSGTTLFRTKLLYRIVNYLHCQNILELGTSLGLATYAMGLASKETTITTIEGCPNISAFTKTNFERLHLANVNLVTGNFNNSLENLMPNTYDLIFFDGNHQKEATLCYFETLLQKVHNDTAFIFDDIYWSKGMTEAWETIKQHPKVTVTIDTFFWGLVFFRKEQVKEHFVIRV